MAETITLQSSVREKLYIDLYKKAFPSVARYISKSGGSLDEAKDIFQDSLILYFEKKETISSSEVFNETGYIVGIAKHLWHKNYRDKSQNISIENHSIELSDSEENKTFPSTAKLLTYLESAGKKCLDILKAFYYDKRNAAEIAEKFGYSGVRSATVQKFKCLEKIRDSVQTNSINYEDFLE